MLACGPARAGALAALVDRPQQTRPRLPHRARAPRPKAAAAARILQNLRPARWQTALQIDADVVPRPFTNVEGVQCGRVEPIVNCARARHVRLRVRVRVRAHSILYHGRGV